MHRAYFHIPLLRENYTCIIYSSEGCSSGDSFCDVLKRHRAPSYTGRTRGFEKGLAIVDVRTRRRTFHRDNPMVGAFELRCFR
jgi:hypothetical protein